MNKNLPLCFFASFIFFTFSCTKNDLPSAPSKRVKMVIDQHRDSILYHRFSYDPAGRLASVFDSTNSEFGSTWLTSLEYDAQGKLVGADELMTSKYSGDTRTARYDFEYDDRGNIVKKHVTKPMSSKKIFNIFIYDNKNRLLTDSLYLDQNTVYSYVNYTYDSRDNVISRSGSEKQGNYFPEPSVAEFTYDGQPNPLKTWGMILYIIGRENFWLSSNNIIRIAYGGGSVYDYLYDYQDGVPLTVTEMWGSRKESEISFIYE